MGPYLTFSEGTKVINWYGAIFALQSLALGIFWYGAMSILEPLCKATGWDEKMRVYDWTGKTWSRAILRLTGCSPKIVTGLENLPREGQGVLICANHASWFDIPVAAFLIPSTFKFMSAMELTELPGVGKQLRGGKHVLIDRSTRRSQLRSFKEALAWLNSGVGVFAFPEGTRSRTGRLQPFKGGVFAMATKTGVPILPISLVGTFDPYPPWALLPIRPTDEMEVHFHPLISTDGKTEAELEELVRAAIVSRLPPSHLPLPEDDEAEVAA